ncbi:MAG: hypothetical protein ACU0DW_13055 [Shimia sp.]
MKPQPPADYDENPPLDDAFWSEASPSLENPALLAALYGVNPARVWEVLRGIVDAHDRGVELDSKIAEARKILHAAE